MKNHPRKRNDLEFYDRMADRWWQPNEKIYTLSYLNSPRFTFFDYYVKDWQGLNVLDVGCGGGYSCEFMAAKGASVSGIDRSYPCIISARNHAATQNWEIDYKVGQAEALPWQNDTFDAVICVDVLEHVVDWQKAVAEIYRVLRPQGYFFFDTINRTFKSKLIFIVLLEDILQEIPRGVHDWHKFIQPQELQNCLIKVGFSDIDIKGFDLFGIYSYQNIRAYIHYKKTRRFQAKISDNTSLMYIGKAMKGKEKNAEGNP
ncbi:bifunctional 2-polyprenyl-6-hydroxyphenol methylase/3-demethylubiquinol 3-O-methyltransferase UbiG [Coleofasciculus chthonoplastes]|nr:bifunctional 2-polyprenyl-6-hydroxyphenol methylase/3-demethylubiquinol 3-O-methyltransferase UbiG [Coleofasciculus chthonoplastes]